MPISTPTTHFSNSRSHQYSFPFRTETTKPVTPLTIVDFQVPTNATSTARHPLLPPLVLLFNTYFCYHFTSTFGGNPLVSAVVFVSLAILREEVLIERSAKSHLFQLMTFASN